VVIRKESQIPFVLADHDNDDATQDTLHRIDMSFVGEFSQPIDPISYQVKTHFKNFFFPHCGPTGITNVPGYNRIIYENVYDDIDAHFYSGTGGQRMAFVVKPGGDPSRLQLFFQGQDSLAVDLNGFLRLYFDQRWIRLPEAQAFQVGSNNTVLPVTWVASYAANNGTGIVTFSFSSYDPSLPLVFQVGAPPALGGGGGGTGGLDWCTLIGSNNDGAGNAFMTGSALANDGDILVAGTTLDEMFPVLLGTSTNDPYWNIFYARFDYAPGDPSADAQLLHSSYYGGNFNDKPIAAYFSTAGDFYVGGWTNSTNVLLFPQSNPLDNTYYQGSNKGQSDALILKINATTGIPIRTTYFGSTGKEMITAITESTNGQLLFTGATSSPSGVYANNCVSPVTGFPLCNPNASSYAQQTNGGGTDGFVARFNNTFNLTWSTFYGGPGNDRIFDATYRQGTIGAFQDRFVVVGRSDAEIPQGQNGAFHLGGNVDSSGFISSFDGDGLIKWTTHLHGLIGLSSVTASHAGIVVQGVTTFHKNAITSCNAVANEVSACNSNGGYFDTVGADHDEYFGEFDVVNGSLLWSTLFGEDSCRETSTWTDTLFYAGWNDHPFLINRHSDIKMDGENNLWVLGIAENGIQIITDTYYTVNGYGLYNKPWTPGTGTNQTDVTLKCFDRNRDLVWSSVFGSGFLHIGGPYDYLNYDFPFIYWGSDFGEDLLIYQDEVIYWTGSSGGNQFPHECPYPNTSWCEDTVVVGNAIDQMNGFIARMPIGLINVGLQDEPSATFELRAFPNPTTSVVQLSMPVQNIVVLDVSGRQVPFKRVAANTLQVEQLLDGVYVIRCTDLQDRQQVVRFVKH
jgi:hypothetical protein